MGVGSASGVPDRETGCLSLPVKSQTEAPGVPPLPLKGHDQENIADRVWDLRTYAAVGEVSREAVGEDARDEEAHHGRMVLIIATIVTVCDRSCGRTNVRSWVRRARRTRKDWC